jgi:hypothetical protein
VHNKQTKKPRVDHQFPQSPKAQPYQWSLHFLPSRPLPYHELPHGCQAFNMSIILLVFVDVYKHLKIFNGQPRVSKVYANAYNAKDFFLPQSKNQ